MVKGRDIGGFEDGLLEHPRPVVRPPPWRAELQSRQAHPEEVHEPSWGTAKAGTLTLLPCGAKTMLSPRCTM